MARALRPKKKPRPPARPMTQVLLPVLRVGDVVTSGRGSIVERIESFRRSTLSGTPGVTPEDHERATAYAERFRDQKGQSAGGKPASPNGSCSTRTARSQPGKRSSSNISALQTVETQSGSVLAHKSQESPSHSAKRLRGISIGYEIPT